MDILGTIKYYKSLCSNNNFRQFNMQTSSTTHIE